MRFIFVVKILMSVILFRSQKDATAIAVPFDRIGKIFFGIRINTGRSEISKYRVSAIIIKIAECPLIDPIFYLIVSVIDIRSIFSANLFTRSDDIFFGIIF